ncbi:MAG: hypothetical protein FWE36_00265 [Erysipelotrichales bacterium]|nr:hypothetical protein [Erysipelotrichales bacterium]
MEKKNKISYVFEAEQISGTTFGRGECDSVGEVMEIIEKNIIPKLIKGQKTKIKIIYDEVKDE